MFKKTAIIAGSFFLIISNALAADAPLTVDAAKRFVASLDAVKALGEQLEASGKTEQMQFDVQPKPGEEFRPYSKSVMAMKAKYPSDYAQLQKAVKSHGFGAEAWGVTGDRVMLAYMARKMEKENPGAMAQMHSMDASMLEMMPPEMKQQLAQAQAMMQTIAAAPPADKKVVAEVEAELDAFMDKEERAHAGRH